jgi:hypothetical protein
MRSGAAGAGGMGNTGGSGAAGGTGGAQPCAPGECSSLLAWARQGGGGNRDYGYGVDVAADGSVYALGTFSASAIFGTTTLVAEQQQDTFLARYDAEGALLWATDTVGTGEDNGVRLGAVASGGVVTSGWITAGDAVTFGAGTTAETTLSSSGLEDVYVARYTADGALSWVRRAGGSDTDRPTDIAVASDGRSVVVGRHWDSATFGAGESNQTVLAGDGATSRLFVASYAPNGDLEWAVSASGSASLFGQGIALNGDGSVLVTGKLEAGSFTFGAGEIHETTISVDGGSMFLARFDDDGALSWVKVAGQSDAMQGAEGRDVVVTSSGDVVVVSSLFGSAVFGPGDPGATSVDATVSTSLVVSRHDSDGTIQWAESVLSTYCWSYAVAATADDAIVTSGIFKGTAVFGAGTPGETSLIAPGPQNDAFVARYDAGGSLTWVEQAGGAHDARGDYGYDVAVGPDGSPVIVGQFAGSAILGPGDPNQTSLDAQGKHDFFVAKLSP